MNKHERILLKGRKKLKEHSLEELKEIERILLKDWTKLKEYSLKIFKEIYKKVERELKENWKKTERN